MKALVWLVALMVVGGVTVQLYHLYKSNDELDARVRSARAEEDALAKEHDQLQADVSYFSQPENVAKELKAKFDYRKPGEKLIKIQ